MSWQDRNPRFWSLNANITPDVACFAVACRLKTLLSVLGHHLRKPVFLFSSIVVTAIISQGGSVELEKLSLYPCHLVSFVFNASSFYILAHGEGNTKSNNVLIPLLFKSTSSKSTTLSYIINLILHTTSSSLESFCLVEHIVARIAKCFTDL